MTRITVQKIADEVGLSKYAVSRALSGKSGVSEATRKRVNDTAERLGYRKPRQAARLLGVVFDDSDYANSELHMQIQNGIQSDAQRLGFGLRMRATRQPREIEALAEECDGLLIVGAQSEEGMRRAYALGKPVVRSGWLQPLEQVDQVGGTDHEAGSAVAHFLLAKGHRNIVYVHGDPRFRGRMERLYGLREVCEPRGDVTLHDLVLDNGSELPEAIDRLEKQNAGVTAYFCAHDGLALTVISELLRRGRKVPDDCSVIGFGDFSAAQQISPAMTTVRVPGINIGRMAAWMLDQRISNPDFPSCPMRLHVPCQIIERGSSGPAPNTLASAG